MCVKNILTFLIWRPQRTSCIKANFAHERVNIVLISCIRILTAVCDRGPCNNILSYSLSKSRTVNINAGTVWDLCNRVARSTCVLPTILFLQVRDIDMANNIVMYCHILTHKEPTQQRKWTTGYIKWSDLITQYAICQNWSLSLKGEKIEKKKS